MLLGTASMLVVMAFPCMQAFMRDGSMNQSLPALVFFFVYVFFLSVDQLAHTNPLFLVKDWSTVAQQAEVTVDEHFLSSCM